MFIEVGRVPIKGQAQERLLGEAAEAILAEAGLQ